MSNHSKRQDRFPVLIQDVQAHSLRLLQGFISTKLVNTGEAQEYSRHDRTPAQLSEFLRRLSPAHTVCHEQSVGDFLSGI